MPMIFSDASSNRWMIRPARPRATASGLSTTSVRSRKVGDSATVVLSLSQDGHRVAARAHALAMQAGPGRLGLTGLVQDQGHADAVGVDRIRAERRARPEPGLAVQRAGGGERVHGPGFQADPLVAAGP